MRFREIFEKLIAQGAREVQGELTQGHKQGRGRLGEGVRREEASGGPLLVFCGV